MTTSILVAPGFSRRWHLGGRVEALSPDLAVSLRARLLERVIATLKQDGVWERQRGLARPRDVTRLAVIHPAGAAGWADIAAELARWERSGLIRVRSHAAPFEGDGAVAGIVTALQDAAGPLAGFRPDLILLVRGGGSRVSLSVLDDEKVARAILACPVPVVCGTGHAHDRSLADQIAWYAADTPSKALALVAELMRSAARAAIGDMDTIRSAASMRVLAQAEQLATLRHTTVSAVSSLLLGVERRLGDVWARTGADLSLAARARIQAQRAELDGWFAAVMLQGPRHLERAAAALTHEVRSCIARATILLGRADDAQLLLLKVEAHAAALLRQHGAALQQRHDSVGQCARTALDRCAAGLEWACATIDAGDPRRMLEQGYALVIDDHGQVVRSCAEASGQDRLMLTFKDGELVAVPKKGWAGGSKQAPTRTRS